MKLKEIAQKKPSQGKSLKLLITESQFKRLAENVVLLQEQNLIKNTHLLKISRNINR
jgi:hypothetical protein